jgi:signal transduction histidine kinase
MTQLPSTSRSREPSEFDALTRGLRERGPRLSSGRAIGFFAHFIAYSLTCVLVFAAAGRFPALMVALSWGIGLSLHGFFALFVPILHALEVDPDEELTRQLVSHLEGAPALLTSPRERGVDAQRARALEELSAAIAHEIRNPITAAKSLVQQIAEDPSAVETAEHARVAVEELDRVERSIAHLLRFAREEPFEPTALDGHELIDSAVDLLRDRAERQGVRIDREREIERLPSITADGEQLRKVLANLIGNALDAHAQAPRSDAWIKISAGQNLAGDELWIRVGDNGPGLDETQRQRAFQPFYTSKAGGTGLGLALARKVLARHGGSIELVNSKGPGAEFLLSLPRVPEPSARP